MVHEKIRQDNNPPVSHGSHSGPSQIPPLYPPASIKKYYNLIILLKNCALIVVSPNIN